MKSFLPLFFLLFSCQHATKMETMCLSKDDNSDEVVHYIAGAVHMFCFNLIKVKPKTIEWDPTHESQCDDGNTKYEVKILCEDF